MELTGHVSEVQRGETSVNRFFFTFFIFLFSLQYAVGDTPIPSSGDGFHKCDRPGIMLMPAALAILTVGRPLYNTDTHICCLEQS